MKVKIGIIRERKSPPDARTPLTPGQCAEIMRRFPVEVVVEPSPIRCFPDSEYAEAGVNLQTDLSDCGILLGVKEVPPDALIPAKTYLFFSHTIKQQRYNRKLLQVALERKIRLIDYEVITDEEGNRLIAFGYYAGIVGAHNALYTYGRRTGAFELPRMAMSLDYATVKNAYAGIEWPPIRVVLTGGGRVATGAVRNLHDMGFKQVSPEAYLQGSHPERVFTQLFASDYVRHPQQRIFDKKHFYQNSGSYQSTFLPYAEASDVFINGIYYDGKAPAFFTRVDMQHPAFTMRVIADISCDIVPEASVPCTLRPSTIQHPIYGYNPFTNSETPPFQPDGFDVMAIDNLPSELPRDASGFFGNQLIDNILPDLLADEESAVIGRATLVSDGQLRPAYRYLSDFVASAD
jgi:alanine dehydrogenase